MVLESNLQTFLMKQKCDLLQLEMSSHLAESSRLRSPSCTGKEISDKVSCTEVMYFNSFTCNIHI